MNFINRKLASEGTLGFNPYSKQYNCFVVEVTPKMAQYILDYHNADNRLISKPNINAIERSVSKHGWLPDGNPMIFSTSGNITEAQHRLEVIVNSGITVKMIVVVGADPDSFIKSEPGKRRTARDIISRRDKSITSDQATTLKQLLKRRAGFGSTKNGCPELNLTNAYPQWQEWKTYILKGEKLTESFFDGTVTEFAPWERQFRAWATLMVFIGKGKVVKPFLQAFKAGLLHRNSPLFNGVIEFMRTEDIAFLTGEKKAAKVHFMLCHATDRFIEAGMSDLTQFAGDVEMLSHDRLLRKGVYRSFLRNPEGLKTESLTII